MCEQTNKQTEIHTHVCVNRQTDKPKDIPTSRELTAAAPLPLPAFSVALSCADGVGGLVNGCGGTAGRLRGGSGGGTSVPVEHCNSVAETAGLLRGATSGRVLVPIEHCDNVRGSSDVFSAATTSILTITILNG